MRNTSKSDFSSQLEGLENKLIDSLRDNPLIAIVRPKKDELNKMSYQEEILEYIEAINRLGIKNIEIEWSSVDEWQQLIISIKNNFPDISLGAASINHIEELDSIRKLNLTYAISPIWSYKLQAQAKELNQILIPGLFSPTEIYKSIDFGCRIIKLFPASILGKYYLKHLKDPIKNLPFVIAAGGLGVKDIRPWLEEGYGAIAIGKNLSKDSELKLLRKEISGQ